MNDISLPIYVNDAHLCVVVLVSLPNVVVGRLRVGVVCVCVCVCGQKTHCYLFIGYI